MSRPVWALLAGSAISIFLVVRAPAQSPESRAPANLAQLMKGTLYPASNVMFAAQNDNPADIPHAKDPNMATDPLTSSYGKWEAVENSALSLSVMANLLTLPGLKCANGLEVPLKNADWAKFVQELRDAGVTAYAAAQTKNQDKMIDAAGVMSTACAHCHGKYRDRVTFANRCK